MGSWIYAVPNFIVSLFVVSLMIITGYKRYKKYKENLFRVNNIKLIKGEKID